MCGLVPGWFPNVSLDGSVRYFSFQVTHIRVMDRQPIGELLPVIERKWKHRSLWDYFIILYKKIFIAFYSKMWFYNQHLLATCDNQNIGPHKVAPFGTLPGEGGGGGYSHTSLLPIRVHQPRKWTLNGVSHHVTLAPAKWHILIVIWCWERYPKIAFE